MQVQIEKVGVQGIPMASIPQELWDNVEKCIGEMAYVNVYHCSAVSGKEADILEQGEIPDGIYELPDKDWEYSDEERENDMWDEILEDIDEE